MISIEEQQYGKTVTVVSGFDVSQSKVDSLASSVKLWLAATGAVSEARMELQSNHPNRVPELVGDYGYSINRVTGLLSKFR